MLTRDHLLRGLNALSRAHESNYFGDGHRGAAMIAAHYLCRRENTEPGAARIIAQMVDHEWGDSALFAPFPEEAPQPGRVEGLVWALAASTDCLRQAGHNVILPSLALKALADIPEAATPARLDGLCRLVKAFTPHPSALEGEEPALPALDDPAALARFALVEALATMQRFEGRGQGWTGHLLTHAQAVVDLAHTGHRAAAEKALAGLGHYLKRVRMGPDERDAAVPEHAPEAHGPLTEAYWQQRQTREVGLGHCFKYPYALGALLDLVGDAELRRACLAEAYRIL